MQLESNRCNVVMVRQISPARQCLSCGLPFEGWSGRLAGWLGASRSLENPNLCNRCRGHLVEGMLAPCSVLQLELGSSLLFGRVPLGGSGPELEGLKERLRRQVEAAGGFVMPQAHGNPGFRAFFNVPVALPLGQHAARALEVASALMRDVSDEATSLGLAIPARLAVITGFAEVLQSLGDTAAIPFCQRADLLPELLARAGADQIAVDDETLSQAAPPRIVSERGSLALLDATGARSLRSLRMPRPAASTPLTPVIALLATLLAVPCVAMVVVSPVAVSVGFGALFAAVLPLYKAIGMSLWPRVLVTGLAVLLASVNLIVTESRLRQLRILQRQAGVTLRLPRWQRLRLQAVRLLSWTVLLLVALEGVLRVTRMNMPLL